MQADLLAVSEGLAIAIDGNLIAQRIVRGRGTVIVRKGRCWSRGSRVEDEWDTHRIRHRCRELLLLSHTAVVSVAVLLLVHTFFDSREECATRVKRFVVIERLEKTLAIALHELIGVDGVTTPETRTTSLQIEAIVSRGRSRGGSDERTQGFSVSLDLLDELVRALSRSCSFLALDQTCQSRSLVLEKTGRKVSRRRRG
jgi:hypothetical protein